MILFDGIVFSLQPYGGISTLFTEILSRLPTSSYELLGFRQSPPPTLASASYAHQRPRFLERYRRARVEHGADIFHSTYYRLPDSGDSKIVTTVYDFVYERFAPVHRRAVHGFQKRKAIARSDKLICISESTRRDLIAFSGSSLGDRAVVIPLGVSEEFHPVAHVEVRPQVLFVGIRGAYKNFAAVVDAISGLRDVDLVCVGGGEFARSEIDMMERRIPGRYRSSGYLSTAALNLEYNRSLCLAYPSLYEGFGIPILEAMRAGCPVVAVNRSSVPEVAGDAALLLQRGDADEIRTAIQSIMVSSTRNDLVRRGRARAAKFGWDETVKKTIAVYEELTGSRVWTAS